MNGNRYTVLSAGPDSPAADGSSRALADLDSLVLGSGETGRSGHRATPRAIGARLVDGHLWWAACSEAVTAAPQRLLSWYTGTDETALTYIERHGPNALAAAKVVAGLGVALRAGTRGVLDETARDALRRAIEYWPHANVLVKAMSRAGVYVPPALRTPGLDAVVAELDTMAGGAVRTLVALQAAMLGGADPLLRCRQQIQVLFELDEHDTSGASGTVTTAILPGGPSGLFPDPRTMSFLRADEAFADSLTAAWQYATRNVSDPPCVLWRVTTHGQQHRVVSGGSLGAAFAVALTETLTGRARRWSPGAVLRTVRAQCAVTGTVDPDGSIGPVGGLDSKFLAAKPRRWRVVAPAANRPDAEQKRPDGVRVSWVSTVGSARRQVRRWRPLRTIVAGVTVTALLAVAGITMGATGLLSGYRSEAEMRLRTSRAQNLVLRADLLRDRQHDDALRLGIAALAIQPSNEARAGLVTTLLAVNRTATITGFQQAVRSVAVSTDRSTVLVADHNGEDERQFNRGTATLWNVADPTLPQQLSTLESGRPSRSVALSPDGRLALVGFADASAGGAVLWDLTDPRRPRWITTLAARRPTTSAVAFARNGRLAVLAETCGDALLWDISDRTRPRRAASLPLSSCNAASTGEEKSASLAISSDGRTVLFTDGNENGRVGIWDISNPARPRKRATLDGHADAVTSMAFRGDGRVAVSGSRDRSVIVWDMQDPARPRVLTTLYGSAGAVKTVAFSGDGRVVLSGGEDGAVQLWDASVPARARLAASLGGHAGSVETAVISSDGGLAVTAGSDRTAALWDLTDRSAPRQVATVRTGTGFTAMAVNANADIAITGSASGEAILWDLTERKRPRAIRTLARQKEPIPSMSMSPDGIYALTPGPAQATVLWDLADRDSPRGVATIPGHSEQLSAMAVAPDGRTAVTGDNQGNARLWRVRGNGTVEAPIPLPGESGGTAPVVSVSYETRGRTVLVGRGDGTITLWDVTEPAQPRRNGLIITRTATVGSVAYSPDGKTVLTSGLGDWAGELWDVTDPELPTPAGVLTAYADAIAASTFSPSNAALLSGSYDGTAVLWNIIDPTRPRRLTVLRGGGGAARHVALSADVRTAVIGTDKGNLTILDLSPAAAIIGDPLTHACDRAAGGLDPGQWKRYIPDIPYRETCAPR